MCSSEHKQNHFLTLSLLVFLSPAIFSIRDPAIISLTVLVSFDVIPLYPKAKASSVSVSGLFFSASMIFFSYQVLLCFSPRYFISITTDSVELLDKILSSNSTNICIIIFLSSLLSKICMKRLLPNDPEIFVCNR